MSSEFSQRLEKMVRFESDDHAWAAALLKKDEEAKLKLKDKIKATIKKHPFGYHKPVKPVAVTEVGSTQAAHIAAALESKEDN